MITKSFWISSKIPRISWIFRQRSNIISTIKTVVKEHNDSFQYSFVNYSELTPEEKSVFDSTAEALELVNAQISYKKIFISEKLRMDDSGETLGVYEIDTDRIIIRRSQLSKRSDYLGTLIHEVTHADTHFPDVSRGFESKLTSHIGKLADEVLSKRQQVNDLSNKLRHATASADHISSKETKPVVIYYSVDNLAERSFDELEKLYEHADEEDISEDAIAICTEILKRREDDQYYFERSSYYSAAGFNEKAIEDINAAIRMNPQRADYYCWKASYYKGSGQYHLANTQMKKALSSEPASAVVFEKVGRFLLTHDLFSEHIEYFKKYIDLFSDSQNPSRWTPTPM